MTKSKLYLALQAAVCIILAAWLSISAIGIYRDGSVRKAENPMESIYSPETVAGKFAPIAPLFFVGAGLMIAGMVMGVKDENAGKPVKDPELDRDQLVSRVASPSESMMAERRRQSRLLWIGRGLFALCMLPILVYLLDPAHFPEADLEEMFIALLRVLLPWTCVGLGALAVTSSLREKSILVETQAASEQLKEEKAKGITAPARPAESLKNKGKLQTVIIAAAVICIIAGIFNGSALDVLYKAITICTECVGLG